MNRRKPIILPERRIDRPEGRSPQEFAVCMGMDALRICLGKEPRNFTPAEVVRWMNVMLASRTALEAEAER